jgi:hypothetical protein
MATIMVTATTVTTRATTTIVTNLGVVLPLVDAQRGDGIEHRTPLREAVESIGHRHGLPLRLDTRLLGFELLAHFQRVHAGDFAFEGD